MFQNIFLNIVSSFFFSKFWFITTWIKSFSSSRIENWFIWKLTIDSFEQKEFWYILNLINTNESRFFCFNWKRNPQMKQQIQNKKKITNLSTNSELHDQFIKITMCQLSNVFCSFIPVFVQKQWQSLFEKSFQNLF